MQSSTTVRRKYGTVWNGPLTSNVPDAGGSGLVGESSSGSRDIVRRMKDSASHAEAMADTFAPGNGTTMGEERIVQARTDYRKMGLDEEQAGMDPLHLFMVWLDEAQRAQVPDHNAMMLATAGSASISCRVVLLRLVDERGFVFFTNYNSRKAMDLERDPRTALTFFWPALERQVRIEGRAERLPLAESDAYFASRPRESCIGAWSSDQSRVVENRPAMEERFRRWEERFEGKEVPRPDHWGGILVRPVRIEFWQGGANRLHDRIAYEHFNDGSWQRMRLQP
jgi:pyridoxamine 5'-phosphate oxidase